MPNHIAPRALTAHVLRRMHGLIRPSRMLIGPCGASTRPIPQYNPLPPAAPDAVAVHGLLSPRTRPHRRRWPPALLPPRFCPDSLVPMHASYTRGRRETGPTVRATSSHHHATLENHYALPPGNRPSGPSWPRHDAAGVGARRRAYAGTARAAPPSLPVHVHAAAGAACRGA